MIERLGNWLWPSGWSPQTRLVLTRWLIGTVAWEIVVLAAMTLA